MKPLNGDTFVGRDAPEVLLLQAEIYLRNVGQMAGQKMPGGCPIDAALVRAAAVHLGVYDIYTTDTPYHHPVHPRARGSSDRTLRPWPRRVR